MMGMYRENGDVDGAAYNKLVAENASLCKSIDEYCKIVSRLIKENGERRFRNEKLEALLVAAKELDQHQPYDGYYREAIENFQKAIAEAEK
jgi:hypothetical protein